MWAQRRVRDAMARVRLSQTHLTVRHFDIHIKIPLPTDFTDRRNRLKIMTPLDTATWDTTPAFTLQGLKTQARVLDVYDGDTMTLAIPWKDGCYKFQVRLFGVDTAEIRGSTRERALEARSRVLSLVTNGTVPDSLARKALRARLSEDPFLVDIECGDFDKYGRVLARVFVRGGRSLSDTLIEEGLAVEYLSKREMPPVEGRAEGQSDR